MAFSAANSSSEPRSFSIGTQKIQMMTWSAVSGDTSGTITADRLSSISHILMDGGLVLNAAPSYSGNVATIAFNDPTATVYGTVIIVGR